LLAFRPPAKLCNALPSLRDWGSQVPLPENQVGFVMKDTRSDSPPRLRKSTSPLRSPAICGGSGAVPEVRARIEQRENVEYGGGIWKHEELRQTRMLEGASPQRPWPCSIRLVSARLSDVLGHPGYLKAVWLKIFGPVFLGFRPEIDPKTFLDRRGLPGTSICTKNQPRRPILKPFRGTQKLPPDCLQVPSWDIDICGLAP